MVTTTLKESASNGPTGDPGLTDELKSKNSFVVSSLKSSQEANDPDVSISFQESDNRRIPINAVEQTERTSANAPALVSRTPSWTGTEALPALGRIRRGSFCDVKTFTSGKVLDLLSSCEAPAPEKKNSKRFLEVENEDLKYCRYLRSVTPEHGEIPLKYRPSSNIIIGHTKFTPLQ